MPRNNSKLSPGNPCSKYFSRKKVRATVGKTALKDTLMKKKHTALKRNIKKRHMHRISTQYTVYTCAELQTLLSPVLMFGAARGVSSGLKLCKPVILSFQHCASVRQANWQLALHSAPLDPPPFHHLAHWKVRYVI